MTAVVQPPADLRASSRPSRSQLEARGRRQRARLDRGVNDIETRLALAADAGARVARIAAVAIFASAALGMMILLIDGWRTRRRRH